MEALAPEGRDALAKNYCMAMDGNGCAPWVCDLDRGHDGLHSGPNRLGIRLSWGRIWLMGDRQEEEKR